MLNLVENPESDHLRKMATFFDATFDEGNDACIISMDNFKAKGFISSYQIFKGLSLWVYNLAFHSDFEVDLGLSEDRPLYFSYNVKGHFLHRFDYAEEYAKILQNQNMVVRGNPDHSVQIVFPANTKLEIAIIIVDLKLLGDLDTKNARRMHDMVQEIFQKITSHHTPYRHLGKIDSETGKYASIVCENDDVDLIGGLLTEGAVLNMLASQLKAFKEEEVSNPAKLSKTELSKITSLGEYVLNNLETKMTIDSLSKMFQLSPKKLQLGVKHLYGDTVGNYTSNLRLGHAKHLFRTTDLNVSEVCLQIGLSSRSYFSKIFKNRFGLSPSLYRTRLRNPSHKAKN